MDLLLGAVVFGVLLGCFYAAVSVGLSVSFGLLDVPHVAHPAFLVLASYGVYQLNESYDIDPLLAGLAITPLFFLFGLLPTRLLRNLRAARQRRRRARHRVFLRHRLHHRGADRSFSSASTSARSRRPISASPGGSASSGSRSGQLVAFAVALGLTVLLALYLSKTFMGRAIRAVAQDEEALR
jgi:branched-chain amino acid transport system permease protein